MPAPHDPSPSDSHGAKPIGGASASRQGQDRRPAPGQGSIRSLLRHGTARLRTASGSPRLDCELLLAHALDVDRAALYARSAETLSSEYLQRFDSLLGQRAGGRPVAQIIGRKEFRSLKFELTQDVLAPRPETELLVEVLIACLGERRRRMDSDGPGRRWRCLDLGTGCGAVAVVLARLLPRSRVIATDVSAAALDVARRNAERLAPGRIRFVAGSWYEPAGEEWRFDAIACNPPYVESRLCRQPPLHFEPREALDGGPDGLRQLRAVISGAPQCLEPGGILAIEHGARQGQAVAELMAGAGFQAPATHRDLAGHDRVTAACMSD